MQLKKLEPHRPKWVWGHPTPGLIAYGATWRPPVFFTGFFHVCAGECEPWTTVRNLDGFRSACPNRGPQRRHYSELFLEQHTSHLLLGCYRRQPIAHYFRLSLTFLLLLHFHCVNVRHREHFCSRPPAATSLVALPRVRIDIIPYIINSTTGILKQ